MKYNKVIFGLYSLLGVEILLALAETFEVANKISYDIIAFLSTAG